MKTIEPLVILAALLVAPASAHDAKSGWRHPLECCSNKDCREISASQISERPEGYVIQPTGERIPYSDHRIRVSPDGVYHWCSMQGRNDSATICLFIPPQSF